MSTLFVGLLAFLAGFGLREILFKVLRYKEKGDIGQIFYGNDQQVELDRIERRLRDFIEEVHNDSGNTFGSQSFLKKLEDELQDLNQSLHHRFSIIESKLVKDTQRETPIRKPTQPTKTLPQSSPRKFANTLDTPKQQIEKKTEVLFTKAPSQDGRFWIKDLTEEYARGKSVYKLQLAPGGLTASFSFVEDEEVVEKMTSFPDDYVKPVCEYEGIAPHLANRVILVEAGNVVRDHKQWKVERKAVIEFE